MLAKPINNTVKKHFNSLFEKANVEARRQFSDNFEIKLKNLDHFNQLKLIIEELARLEEIINKNKHPYYIKNHSSEDWLLNQFASRTFLLNVDESDQLFECIRIGEYRSLIVKEKFRLKDGIPLYSYSEFIEGKIDPYFSNFDYVINLSEEEYYKIRDWQADKLVKVVSYESRMLIKQIQSHCKTLSNPLEFILSEKEKIESRLEKANSDAQEIKSILSELFLFRNINTNIFDDNLLVENFKIYKSEQSEQINWKYITPAYINPLIEKIDRKATEGFWNEATLFFTINKIAHWFDVILKGQSIQQPVKETNWNEIFNKIKKGATIQVKSLCKDVDTYIETPGISDDEIKKYLIGQLEIYRHKFNDFKNKYYFALLKEDKKDILRRMFITNSFFSNDLKEQSESIKEAIIINEISWKIVCAYGAIFDTRKMDFPDNDASHIEIMFLMHQMVLDKELYAELNKCMDDFFEHFQSFFLPIEIYFQNHRVFMTKLFRKSLDRLQTILDDSDPSNKILYLHSRLKQLKQRELEFKQHEHDSLFYKKELRYSNLFKEFLEIEAEFIRETKDCYLLFNKPMDIPKLKLNEHPVTFDNILAKTNASFILEMLENLGITVNGKSILSERKKGSIRGIVEALRDNCILPNKSIDFLCNLIASKIGLEIKSKLDFTETSNTYKKKANQYITVNYKK